MASTFRLAEQMRSGACSSVWHAWQLPLERSVVVKFYQLQPDSPASRDLLRIELSRLRDLRHPNNLHLVDIEGPVVAVGHPVPSLPFAVFEYVAGETLRAQLKVSRRLSPLRVWRIALQALGALSEAHEAGVLHRDITPSNLMVWQPAGLEQHLKVIDYGVGLPLPASNGQAQRVIGTPHYLAPEVARGDAPTVRSDLYSLAVVLYEAVAGRRPFDGPDRRSVLEAHVRAVPPPLAEQVPVPDDLAAIIERGLAKDPADRFDSARAFLAELQALSWRKLSRYHFAEFAPKPEEEAIMTDIFEPQAWEAAAGVVEETEAVLPGVATAGVHAPGGARVPLRATEAPTVWLLGDDPATRHAEVQRAATALQARYEVRMLESLQRERLVEQLVSGEVAPPWVAVFGDLHTLVQDPLLTYLRANVSTTRLLLSTHLNGKMIQTTVNFAGLDQHLALPSSAEEIAAAVHKMVERARMIRHQQDQVRLALRDAYDDLERLRASGASALQSPRPSAHTGGRR